MRHLKKNVLYLKEGMYVQGCMSTVELSTNISPATLLFINQRASLSSKVCMRMCRYTKLITPSPYFI